MKRLIIIIIVTLLLLASGAFATCIETDFGDSPFVKGASTYTKGDLVYENVDFCKDEITLLEYFCGDDGKTDTRYYFCECEDGRCIRMIETKKKTEETAEKLPEERALEEMPNRTSDFESLKHQLEPKAAPAGAGVWIWISVAILILAAIIAVIIFLKVTYF